LTQDLTGLQHTTTTIIDTRPHWTSVDSEHTTTTIINTRPHWTSAHNYYNY